MKKTYIKDFFMGLVIGAVMLVPGVSGGTTAIILGIYDKIIDAISNITVHTLKKVLYLSRIALGGAAGIILLAKPLFLIVDKYNFICSFLFMGIVLGSVPTLIKKARLPKLSIKAVLFCLIGAAIVFAIDLLPQGHMTWGSTNSIFSYLAIFITGIITAVALVLPGISVSYMLLVMGMYTKTLKAISSFNLLFLIPLAVSVLVGVLLTTKLLEKAMKRYAAETFMLIAGFVIASITNVFIAFPQGLAWIPAILLFAGGFLAVHFFEQLL